ncbi:hypothetical protein MTBPR1_10111 [Candidatus Terasakiella magnetica]|uniref:HPt domain-containing protein n=1 Tax=Candidatus Terasakiella magnetica TaxID=1867952 RepID=A0A1C3RCA2_9PROT|nr:Hpt domain-containing protein [Candidatus Terasakiella magnetica]SCA54864.1 hypothetical protein MTBPR1_10111 [Candidatus Terasakiella magnetica]
MTDQSEMLEKLKLLRERFTQRLKDTHTEISTWSGNSHITALIEICHKLAGTAGTYGYGELSVEMKTLELQLIDIKDQDLTDEQALTLYKKAEETIKNALK